MFWYFGCTIWMYTLDVHFGCTIWWYKLKVQYIDGTVRRKYSADGTQGVRELYSVGRVLQRRTDPFRGLCTTWPVARVTCLCVVFVTKSFRFPVGHVHTFMWSYWFTRLRLRVHVLVVIKSGGLRVSNRRATHFKRYLSSCEAVHDRPDRLNRTGSAGWRRRSFDHPIKWRRRVFWPHKCCSVSFRILDSSGRLIPQSFVLNDSGSSLGVAAPFHLPKLRVWATGEQGYGLFSL